MKIDDETRFCSQKTLDAMLESKNVFDELPERDLQNARTRANPFETIKGAFFQNRAAMKMANMDAVLDFALTDPKHPKEPDQSWVPAESSELFYFADVCAGPGGFTEYVLWKKRWSAHGFGFTLVGGNDFRLDKFNAADPELFEPFYGSSGKPREGGDGDVTNPENLRSFEEFVKKSTRRTNRHGEITEGVHLFMADGGFSVAGQENLQEIVSKRIYLCQFLCGLSVLRPGGNFVCKLFDVFTPFSAGLVYLMYRAFHSVCIHKPNTSRPANSERYIICRGMLDLEITRPILEYMRLINDKLQELDFPRGGKDVYEIIPMDVMKQDEDFFTYLVSSNELFAKTQTVFLKKYKEFARNPNLYEAKQGTLREDCLKYYRIPDLKRSEPPRAAPQQKYAQLCQEEKPGWASRKPVCFKDVEALQIQNDWPGLDFRCSISTEPTSHQGGGAFLLISLGKRFHFFWNAIRSVWDRLDTVLKGDIMIPKDTILYAESTWKYTGKKQGQKKVPILRVFDALILGGESVGNLPYDERLLKIQKFCRAISHEHSLPHLTAVAPAEVWMLKDLAKNLNRFQSAGIKGCKRLILYNEAPVDEKDEKTIPFFVCRGLYLHRTVNEPWCVCWSNSRKSLYYWKPRLAEGILREQWNKHPDLVSSFKQTCLGRMLWNWDAVKDIDRLLNEESPEEGEGPTLLSVIAFVTEQRTQSAAPKAQPVAAD